jgi:hypothetical protein
MAGRMKAKTIEVKTSHLSLISHQQEIAGLILKGRRPYRLTRIPAHAAALDRRGSG